MWVTYTLNTSKMSVSPYVRSSYTDKNEADKTGKMMEEEADI